MNRKLLWVASSPSHTDPVICHRKRPWGDERKQPTLCQQSTTDMTSPSWDGSVRSTASLFQTNLWKFGGVEWSADTHGIGLDSLWFTATWTQGCGFFLLDRSTCLWSKQFPRVFIQNHLFWFICAEVRCWENLDFLKRIGYSSIH